jgi:hypothetical protein
MPLLSIDPTPNPNAVKLTFDRPIHPSGHATFTSAHAAQGHPIAAPLLSIDGVQSVFVMANFATVTKEAGADWEAILPQIESRLAGV